jgi:hypothetical protein
MSVERNILAIVNSVNPQNINILISYPPLNSKEILVKSAKVGRFGGEWIIYKFFLKISTNILLVSGRGGDYE